MALSHPGGRAAWEGHLSNDDETSSESGDAKQQVAARVHRYEATCSWAGSTGGGYETYSRSHRGASVPARAQLTLSSDPAFRGDPSLLNSEQLLVLAASSCQLLSFLAVAARARIDVVAYEDSAEAEMPEADKPVRITEVRLRPRITLNGRVAEERLRRLVEVAHHECFIANSLSSRVTVDPSFDFQDERPARA